jgi:hypothetical protein
MFPIDATGIEHSQNWVKLTQTAEAKNFQGHAYVILDESKSIDAIIVISVIQFLHSIARSSKVFKPDIAFDTNLSQPPVRLKEARTIATGMGCPGIRLAPWRQPNMIKLGTYFVSLVGQRVLISSTIARHQNFPGSIADGANPRN